MTTSDSTILEIFTFYGHQRIALSIEAAEVLDYLHNIDTIYETHVVTGAAYGPATLIKIYLQIGVAFVIFSTGCIKILVIIQHLQCYC